jgi:hypothetical protein
LYNFIPDKIKMARKGGLLTSTGVKTLTPSSLGLVRSEADAVGMKSFVPTQTRRNVGNVGKGRKGRKGRKTRKATRRRHRK